jgi:hypothetical protein
MIEMMTMTYEIYLNDRYLINVCEIKNIDPHSYVTKIHNFVASTTCFFHINHATQTFFSNVYDTFVR